MMRETIGKVAAITVLALVIQATLANDRTEMRIDGGGRVRISIDRINDEVRFSTMTSNQTGYHHQLMRPLMANDGSGWERHVFASASAPSQAQCFGHFGIVTCWVPVATDVAAQGKASPAFKTSTGHFACLYALGSGGDDTGPCQDLVTVAAGQM